MFVAFLICLAIAAGGGAMLGFESDIKSLNIVGGIALAGGLVGAGIAGYKMLKHR